jgi:hypothetical protein
VGRRRNKKNSGSSMNLGFSESLKVNFPDVIPILKDLNPNQSIQYPNLFSGFTSAEGCYYLKIIKSQSRKRESVSLRFQISQPTLHHS